MGNSIGVCLGNSLGAAWADSGRFPSKLLFPRGAIGYLPAGNPVYGPLSAVDFPDSGKPLAFRPISREITRYPLCGGPASIVAKEVSSNPAETEYAGPPLNPRDGGQGAELPPTGRRRNGENTAGRRAGAGPPHLLSGGLNVHGYIW